jgi:hypothetical protein
MESVRKPLTKDEISFLIEELESRKDKFLIANRVSVRKILDYRS